MVSIPNAMHEFTLRLSVPYYLLFEALEAQLQSDDHGVFLHSRKLLIEADCESFPRMIRTAAELKSGISRVWASQ